MSRKVRPQFFPRTKLVREDGFARVVTGPLFLPYRSEDGRRYVTYEVIGPNCVAVPTHYFKVITNPNITEAFIVPNEEIDPCTPLDVFRTTVEKIEKVSGVIFETKSLE